MGKKSAWLHTQNLEGQRVNALSHCLVIAVTSLDIRVLRGRAEATAKLGSSARHS